MPLSILIVMSCSTMSFFAGFIGFQFDLSNSWFLVLVFVISFSEGASELAISTCWAILAPTDLITCWCD